MMLSSLPRILTSLLLSISLAKAQSSDQCKINNLKTSYAAPVAADGWSYRLVASELSRPRGILFDTEGALIVVDTGVGLVHLELEDQGRTCLRVRKKTVLLENEDLNHGIAISKDGRTLYASTDDEVYSWSYDPSTVRLSESSERTLVTNMTNSGHTSRTLLISEKHPGVLVVSRGSQGNDDVEAEDRSTGHSQLRAFNVSALGEKSKPYDYLDGDLLGWGLRNSVGVAEHPETGGVYSVENSVDNLSRKGRDIHKDNPAEELNFHGFLNGSREDQGGNYGYPLCYTIWSTEDFPSLGDLETGDQFPADRRAGQSTPSDDECNTEYVPPVLAFQAHTAPLDIKFDGNGTSAYISFHGSWNRDEPVGYEISSVAFKDGRPTSSSNSKNATTTIISNPDLSNCPDDCFRPVGLAWDSEGRLWFSSDSTGEIFVLAQDGSDNDNDDDDDDRGESGGDDDDSAASQFMRPSSWAVVVTLVAVIMGFFLA
ncbi:hypothetical protein CEP52_001325 [Fusarium oligoseptatum]|uniref:Pyrroloquinoline quinone-dependent pyranose dehydrogenase beta-propeller domain-containing protein n=1 Tax=Fusarium oligoseptatum TaxID=2604345 RepID=A0A428UJT4_9HYPO|nr:hypothetical protein CEP52_001325 [Fusarium oligoseptatum]